MISKLKRRFIILAMTSLTVLIAVIVAGMNIINYNTVVSNADNTLEMLSDNHGRLPLFFGDAFDELFDEPDADYDDIEAGTGDYAGRSGMGSRAGKAPGGFSRDEAEETRFFTALVNEENEAVWIDTTRIYAVDSDQAGEFAQSAASSGEEKGFIGEYRYKVTTEGDMTRITFLDCGRVLEAYREFLRTSLIISIAGLLAVFVIICYFSGRIVRPVAESYEQQKRFITDAGHEIKTPLAIIKANIDLMKMDLEDAAADEELSGSLNESLDDIDGQVDRLTDLTNDLVYLSRMEEAENTLTMTEVPVSDIISETAESFLPVAQERKKTLSIEVTPMLSVQGSTKELEKLASILIENALKYSPEGDDISIKLTKEGKHAVFEVRNKAASPLTDEDLEHVFDRFYRADKSRNSAAGGHGIGLSMASAIVSAHSGKIRARSGDGTEFIVTAVIPAI